MELVILIICVVVAWAIAAIADLLPQLGHLFIPSPWLVGGGVLILITWLMRH